MIVPSFTPLRNPREKNSPMPDGFQPGEYDVLCGRGKHTTHFVGNRRFRLIINLFTERYLQAKTKLDKSLVVISIVDTIRTYKGGFVKQDRETKQWIEIGDQLAREKVGHALRDAISSNNTNGNTENSEFHLKNMSIEKLMRLNANELEDLERKVRPNVAPPPKRKQRSSVRSTASNSSNSSSSRSKKTPSPSPSPRPLPPSCITTVVPVDEQTQLARQVSLEANHIALHQPAQPSVADMASPIIVGPAANALLYAGGNGQPKTPASREGMAAFQQQQQQGFHMVDNQVDDHQLFTAFVWDDILDHLMAGNNTRAQMTPIPQPQLLQHQQQHQNQQTQHVPQFITPRSSVVSSNSSATAATLAGVSASTKEEETCNSSISSNDSIQTDDATTNGVIDEQLQFELFLADATYWQQHHSHTAY